MDEGQLKDFLDRKVQEYNRPAFIAADPVSVPHCFERKQDIEIAGLFAAIFAWGNRTTIIRKSNELMELMEGEPYQFCLNPTEERLKRLIHFKHRTFTSTDLLYFVEFLHQHYAKNDSLETAFSNWLNPGDLNIAPALAGFHRYFFSLPDAPQRTRKHISTPDRNSSCKRLSMYLRWMVRNDNNGVDFGIWKGISPAQLVCPLDLHVARVARKLGLLERKQTDWPAVEELTGKLRAFDSTDPSRYDFALFSLGVIESF